MNLSTSLSAPRILAVFAHPDDETLCAGGTLALYAEQGAEIMVLSATRGDAGQIHDSASATRRTLGSIREQELRLACERLGVRQVVCLDYGDGTLEQVDQRLLSGTIARWIRRFRPDMVVTFGPDGAYGHPDHIAIGAATTAACAMAGSTTAFPEQLRSGLAPHTAELFYSYFPRQDLLLRDLLARWLATRSDTWRAPDETVAALPLLAKELSVLNCIADHVDVEWYAGGFSIVEQGEPATRLYLVLDGMVELIREDPAGTPHTVAQLGRGSFFGHHDLVSGQASSAHIVARGSVTCLVLAPAAPTAFAGRGTNGAYMFGAGDGEGVSGRDRTARSIDVSQHIDRKIAALAAHRTQCPVAPDMLPAWMFATLLGREHFVRADTASCVEQRLQPACTRPATLWAYRPPVLAVYPG